MLARKGNFFKKSSYYEDFAVYMATMLFFRIKNPKQFEDPPKLKKIKSILNYIKKTIYPRKVDFEQEFYSQVISTPDEEDTSIDTQYTFADRISESVDEISRVEFTACLEGICKTIRKFLEKRVHYSKNSVE